MGCDGKIGNCMKVIVVRALIGFAIVGPLLVLSAVRWWHRASVGSTLQAIGALGLLVVVVAHVCEGFGIFASMGWGQPNTIGHYLDLIGAVAGVALVPIGYVLSRSRRD